MKPLRSVFMGLTRIPPAVMIAGIVLLAFVVAWMVTTKINSGEQMYAEKQKELDAKYSAKVTVVYAIKDIPEGQTIPSEALEERQIEQSKMPEDAITSATLASGRVTKYGVAAGQIVSQHDLQAQGQSLSFDARLKTGFRAVTFAVDNNSGVAGFISPESHIDIIGMVGSGSDTRAKPILSDVEVIAVGQTYQRTTTNGTTTATPASSVTVAVTPEDTTKLIKAVLASKLYLSLRNSNDHTPVATVDVTQLYNSKNTAAVANMNFGVPAPPPAMPMEHHYEPGDEPDGPGPQLASAPAPERQNHQIEAWSGGKKDLITVPER
ncbi:MAG: Flp pilus assembly protein CpaB [Candidatus Obscuribacterales bacterium]|nr:Flp pilus assembly protein CpaB [Cyanobacteria bacterium SZAS LIN-5]RTL46149.1 MAG: Flp pilus assembly protein CpaB [Candidatus Melainabacteria bacterium]